MCTVSFVKLQIYSPLFLERNITTLEAVRGLSTESMTDWGVEKIHAKFIYFKSLALSDDCLVCCLG